MRQTAKKIPQVASRGEGGWWRKIIYKRQLCALVQSKTRQIANINGAVMTRSKTAA